MGCPDSGDADQLPDVWNGYELTADLDFDTNSDVGTDEPNSSWAASSAFGRHQGLLARRQLLPQTMGCR